jgi:hypothetical protein
MTVMLVSENPLFREILSATLGCAGVAMNWSEPACAEGTILRDSPEVVLVDSTLPPTTLAHLLYLATTLHSSRVIMVDPGCNEISLVDLSATTVVNVADLVDAVRAGIKKPPAA